MFYICTKNLKFLKCFKILLNFISERYYKVLYQLFCFAQFCPANSYSLATPLPPNKKFTRRPWVHVQILLHNINFYTFLVQETNLLKANRVHTRTKRPESYVSVIPRRPNNVASCHEPTARIGGRRQMLGQFTFDFGALVEQERLLIL